MRRLAFLLSLLAVAAAGCTRSKPAPADVLLFTGRGTSRGDVAAIEDILRDSRLSYSTANSTQMDALSDSEWRSYRLLVMPGGNFVEMGNGLAPRTTERVRAAVSGGLSYLGLCAGAFLAGNSVYNGMNLTGGVRFPFYAIEARGIRKAAVTIIPASGAALDVYWEDGPQLSGWGEAVARYSDGTPAVVQGSVGRGWVVLTGVHPEAPESWRRGMTFRTPVSVSRAFAAALLDAAYHRTPLPHD